MEPERPFKWNSRISAESKQSQRSSIRSLERGSWEERSPSLNKQHSMIEVMSLESSKKSDIYDKMLAEELPKGSQSLEQEEEENFNPFKTMLKVRPQPVNNRFSYEPQTQIDHVCTCYQQCNQQRCPCFRAKDEKCLEGYCCQECIDSKNRNTVRSGFREPDQKIVCTCKKTKCIKKYCTCFAAGIKCGYACTCEDCYNCDRPVKMEVEPSCVVDEQIKKLDMPSSMEFEPFAFRYSRDSNNKYK